MAHSKSILYVIGTLDGGGAENHIAQIAPKLSKAGFDVSIFCLKKRGRLIEKIEAGGVEVFGPREKGYGSGLSNIWDLSKAAIALRCHLQVRKPDIIHFFLPHAYLIGGLVSLTRPGLIRIMSRRSLNNYQSRHAGFLTTIERLLHGRMDGILGNSKAVVDQLRQYEGVPAETLQVIYNGISNHPAPDEAVEATRVALQLNPETFTMVIVANLIPYKGHDDLITALSMAGPELPDDWQLLIIGEDRGFQVKLQQMAEDNKLQERIKFLGWRGDSHLILENADLGLLCSHEEGFSNAILESMSAGLPMVVTDVGGNAEAVIDGENGIVVAPKSPVDLAAAIVRLSKDKAFARRAGAASKRRIEESFTIDECVKNYATYYNRLLKN